MIKDFIVNVAVLTTFLFFYNSLFPQQTTNFGRKSLQSRLLLGLAMGLLGIILMFFSINVTDHVILDYRQLAVVSAALFGGTYAALLAGAVIGVARLFIQGGITEASLTALFSILLLGPIAGSIVRKIKSYALQWVALFLTMVSISSVTLYYLLGKTAVDVLPNFISIMLVGSGFIAYLLHYISQSNLRQQLIRTSEQNFRKISSLQEAIFQSASEVSIIVTDPLGNITTFNRGAEKLLGYDAAEIIHRETPLRFHLTSEIQKRGEELSKELGKPVEGFGVFSERPRSGKWDEQEWTYVRKDGSYISVNLIITALWFEGEITGFIGIASDITDKKRTEAELVEQNEELQAQQEELQAQQQELTEVLERMEESKNNLLRRNQLAQSLSNTLEKRELLQSIIDAYAAIYKADKGMLIIFNETRDHAAYGISEQLAKQFIAHIDDYVKPRVCKQKKPFTVIRETVANENGFHAGSVPCYDFYTPIPDTDGEVAAIIVISRTGAAITAQEEQDAISLALQISPSLDKLWMYEDTLKQRELTQNMLDTIQEGVQLLDMSGKVLQTNKQFEDLMGTKDLQGLSLEQYLAITDKMLGNAAKLGNYIRGMLERPEQRDTGFNYHIAGTHAKVIHMYAEPMYKGGQIHGILLVHRDITSEFELDRLKSDFVNTVSHELRTPLSSVLGFAELLLNKTLTPEKQQKYVSTIHKEAVRLTALINDFLDLQRMESGRQPYDFQQIDLTTVLQGVAELFKEQLANYDFRCLYPAAPAYIDGDDNKIRQVLMNLLSNAVKYSPNGGAITLSLERSGENWAITLQDEGLGIPPDALPHLFSKFYRVDNSDRRQIGGTGLGLAIVKEIVAVHGGQVSVSSVFGQGSQFTVTLPAADDTTAGGHHEDAYIAG